MWFGSLWNWFTGGIWKSLEKYTTEILIWCKHNLVANSGRSSEEQNDNRNADSEGQAYEVLDGYEDSFENWIRSHSG
jgi:hypothetical protein